MTKLILFVVASLCLTSCITSSGRHCVVYFNNLTFEAAKDPTTQQGKLIIDSVSGKLIITLKPTDSVKTSCSP